MPAREKWWWTSKLVDRFVVIIAAVVRTDVRSVFLQSKSLCRLSFINYFKKDSYLFC